MLKKIISSLTTLLAALLFSELRSVYSTNNQPTASSTEVAKKNEISITISVTPEGQEAQSKTLKVAEESNLMKVLKANYKIEEKNGMITSIDGHSQDEAKGLYWMYKDQRQMAPKGAAETTVKKGQDRILSRSVQIMSSRIMCPALFVMV